MAEQLIFEPNGRAIPYIDEGNAPVVVLLPGRGLNISYLGALAGALTAEDLRIVRIGSRRASDAAVSMHDLAQDVIDVMDHLGLADAWIGGHAFGGSVARTVSLDHHDRVNGVLLLGVEGVARATDADMQALDAEHREILDAAHDPEVESMQRAALDTTAMEDWASVAPGVPVLVIQGTEDRITPPENGAQLQASAPGLVSVVPIEGGGHLFPATHAGQTAWAIEDYLDWD